MAWRLNYLVTTMPRVLAEVSVARSDWEFDHKNDEGGYGTADPRKVGYAVPAPRVKDNLAREYLTELVETHYNEQRDELIFVWKPVLLAEDLSVELKKVPDHNPMLKKVKYAGEQDPEA